MYTLSLYPVLQDLRKQKTCHVRRDGQNYLYGVWFYISVKKMAFETMLVNISVNADDDLYYDDNYLDHNGKEEIGKAINGGFSRRHYFGTNRRTYSREKYSKVSSDDDDGGGDEGDVNEDSDEVCGDEVDDDVDGKGGDKKNNKNGNDDYGDDEETDNKSLKNLKRKNHKNLNFISYEQTHKRSKNQKWIYSKKIFQNGGGGNSRKLVFQAVVSYNALNRS